MVYCLGKISAATYFLLSITPSLLSPVSIWHSIMNEKTNNMREKKQAKILYITAAISLALGSLIDVIFPLLGIGLLPNGACVVIVVWAR